MSSLISCLLMNNNQISESLNLVNYKINESLNALIFNVSTGSTHSRHDDVHHVLSELSRQHHFLANFQHFRKLQASANMIMSSLVC